MTGARATVVLYFVLICMLAVSYMPPRPSPAIATTIHRPTPQTQTATCLPLAGLVILYDASRGQVPLSSRSTVRDYLLSHGITIIENTDETLTFADLVGVHVLWFTDMTLPMTGTTFFTVVPWLQNGGRAIFEGDNALTIQQFDQILEDVISPGGLTWPTSATAGNTTNIFPHFTTAGVDTMWLPHPGFGLADGPFTDLFHDFADDDLCGFETSGNRRLIVVTEDVFLDGVVEQADNFRFATNVVDWMAQGINLGSREISTSPPAAVHQVDAGDTMCFDLVIHNTGTCDLDVTPSLFGTPLLVGPPIFEEDFEDGDYNGWVDAGGPGTKAVISWTAADGTLFSYREYNSAFGHSDGIYAMTDTIQPRRINFWVRSSLNNRAEGYVVLEDSQGIDIVWFFMGGSGTLLCNPAQGGDSSYPYVGNTWYFITFANIDWTAKTFDYYVNGTLVVASVGFRNPGLVNDLDKIELYNFHTNGDAVWDEIRMYNNDGIHWLTGSLSPVTIPPLDSLTVTFKLDASALPVGTYNANITLDSNDPDTPTLDVPVTLTVDTPTGINDDLPRPARTRLHPNYPNPFNPSTTIRYELENAGEVRLAIYDVGGRLVRVLVNERKGPGPHAARWDGVGHNGQVASGVYLYRLEAGDFEQTRKLVFLK